MSKILIIDGNSLMFRAYYATSYTGNLMQTSNGLYTNAVFGFVNMTNKLLERKPDYIFVAFDAGKKTFRHQSYDEYKGGRKPMPDEFRVQIPYIKKYLDCVNIKHVEMVEFEADDLVASVSKLANDNGVDEIMVVSGDKDLLQLVGGNVKVCLTKKGITELEEYTENNFFDKMGFLPSQVPDYKGLVGDSSDNLPGIKGIGEKTAVKLLKEYKTLENIIANTFLIGGKTGTLITEGSKTGLACKNLATLVRDINLDFGLDDLKIKEVNLDDLICLYKELDFKSFLNKLEAKMSIYSDGVEKSIISEKNGDNFDIKIEDYLSIQDFTLDELKEEELIIIPEVFGDNYYKGELLGLGIYVKNKYLFLNKDDIVSSKDVQEVLAKHEKIITFDYKKLYVCLSLLDIKINKVMYDLMLAIYLIDSRKGNDDFKECIKDYLDYNLEDYEAIYGKGVKLAIPDMKIYQDYCLKKAFIVNKIYKQIDEEIDKEGLRELFECEKGLSKVLGDMELVGLIVSKESLEKCRIDLEAKQKEYEDKIYELADSKFNINSPKQLGIILFEKMKLPAGKKNKNGYSTDSSILEYLAKDYEIARKVLDYRKVTKIISTYVNGLFQVMDENGFIHPLYKQALTVTGRLSSVEPNIQNMPIRDDIGKVIREAFVSRFDSGKIVSLDYSQIELRVLSSMASDQKMIDAFNSDYDFHRMTASWIFGKNPNDITSHERSSAKAINFGIVYGMSAWGLSESIGITPKEAKKYIDKYFENHPGIDAFIKNTINEAKINGYTKTYFGRKRYIPELKSMNKMTYQFGERTAVNSPIQGTAADIIKFAMVEVGKLFEERRFKSKLIAQVHDELVFDCVNDEIDIIIKEVKEIMENVVTLKVKLIASSSIGDNWMEA
ncbi:MAG: DNA polymerase I [Bacilli bacterium]|nr:DNA polymerase I [Bacilli bacterium]